MMATIMETIATSVIGLLWLVALFLAWCALRAGAETNRGLGCLLALFIMAVAVGITAACPWV